MKNITERHKYKEIIERYCNVINANAAIMRINCNDIVSYECLSKHECQKKFGNCKNKKYGNV